MNPGTRVIIMSHRRYAAQPAVILAAWGGFYHVQLDDGREAWLPDRNVEELNTDEPEDPVPLG